MDPSHNILKEEIQVIDGSRYRVRSFANRPSCTAKKSNEYTSKYSECDVSCPPENEEEDVTPEDESRFQLEYLSPGRYKGVIMIHSSLIGNVIGKKGAVINEIKNKFQVKVTLPERNSTDKTTIIHGNSKRSILSACLEIDTIICKAKHFLRFTHFVSIPLNFPEIMESFKRFRNIILEEFSDLPNISSEIFNYPTHLHMTLGVMLLLDKDEIQRGINLLGSCIDNIVKPAIEKEPLEIQIRGIKSMNPNASKAKVIYGAVHSEKLQEICDKIVSVFIDEGLMKRERDHVNLHMTIMNSSYIKNNYAKMDCSSIFEKYGDYDFGKTHLKSMHLSNKSRNPNDPYYTPAVVYNLN